MDKLPAYTLYPPRSTLSQSGFAPIALVILLLFGIAAGTLLAQNGVNFLPKAAGPAAQAATGGCDPTYYQNECVSKGKTGGCYQDSKGNPICLLGGSQCSSSTTTDCTDKQKLNGCKVIGGEERCLYPQNIEQCNAKDEASCPGKCRVITREGSKYSECQQECTDGWWNYCYIKYQKGCKKDDKGVPLCDETANPRNVTKVPAAPVTAPANKTPGGPSGGTPGSAATCTNTKLCNYSEGPDKCFSGVCKAGSENDCGFNRNCIADSAGLCTKPVDCKTAGTSGYSSSGSGLNTASNANIPCSDANQMINGIPCYKIGVFDDATREQIEKNARIASNNYKIYQEVLEKLGSEMDEAARNKAKEALAKAQTAAACMNGTSTTPATTTTTTTSGSTSSSLYPCEGSGSTCPLSTKTCHLSRIDSKWYCVDKGVFNKDFYCGDIGTEFDNKCPSNYPTCDKYGQCRNSANAILPGTPKQIP